MAGGKEPEIRHQNDTRRPEPNSCAGNATAGAGLAVKEALALGFNGVDTAHHYMNQRGVAAGIRASGFASRVWVTSKIEACNNSFVRWGGARPKLPNQ